MQPHIVFSPTARATTICSHERVIPPAFASFTTTPS